ncbi:MAG: response regulator transcription factor [Actinomycetota bacterium]|nr:response regulator transcription factor [Actinomycetota bacterium]MDA2983168.1 response regulator transcription factor [Actinomycetota bacterium]
MKSQINDNRTIVVAEDDQSVRNALQKILELEGFKVVAVKDGVAALETILMSEPSAAVIDVMMPFTDGLSVCRELRHRKNRTPILLLTARAEIGDRVAGLDAGADDYLVKPFSVDELLARVRALLRRNSSSESLGVLALADLTLDPISREVTRGDRQVELTKTEFDLLQLFLEQAGVVLSREYLYEHIWGFDFETNSKSLDVYIGYLRRKIESGDEMKLLHTVRGVGYVLKKS